MYICDDCLKDRFYNEPTIHRSLGRCEICEQPRGCSDIPSTALRGRASVLHNRTPEADPRPDPQAQPDPQPAPQPDPIRDVRFPEWRANLHPGDLEEKVREWKQLVQAELGMLGQRVTKLETAPAEAPAPASDPERVKKFREWKTRMQSEVSRLIQRVEKLEAVPSAGEVEAAWRKEAEGAHKNARYYRDLVVQIGQSLGTPAYTADDGGVSDDVLCAKVPGLVVDLIRRRELDSSRLGLLREALVKACEDFLITEKALEQVFKEQSTEANRRAAFRYWFRRKFTELTTELWIGSKDTGGSGGE